MLLLNLMALILVLAMGFGSTLPAPHWMGPLADHFLWPSTDGD